VEHADRRCRRRLDDRPIIREAGCSRRAAIRSYGHHNVMIFLAPRACVTSEADPGGRRLLELHEVLLHERAGPGRFAWGHAIFEWGGAQKGRRAERPTRRLTASLPELLSPSVRLGDHTARHAGSLPATETPKPEWY
jgi:hypothetical protein